MPTPVSGQKQKFWKEYQNKGIGYIMKKYGTVSLKNKVKKKLLKMIGERYSLSNPSTYHAVYSERRAV